MREYRRDQAVENSVRGRSVLLYVFRRRGVSQLPGPSARPASARHRFVAAGRCALLAYLAIVLGLGAALRNLHVHSSDHAHRYCPEHRRIEAVERGHAHGQVAPRGLEEAGVRAAEHGVPEAHVACALLNALLTRAPVAPETSPVSIPAADASRSESAHVEPFEPFDSILSLAPKTSPPAAV